MAKPNEQSNSLSDAFEKFAEAGRHNLTAANLVAAGAVAVSAAAVAYMWDAQRRNQLMDMGRRWGESTMGMWNNMPGMRGQQGQSGQQ